MADPIRITDGQLDFSGGVDSGRVTTLQSQLNPHGLRRNQLAWAGNATVRSGAIIPRPGMQPLIQKQRWSGNYQGGYMYEPDNGFPYLILDIGGRTYVCRVDTNNSVSDVTTPATVFPATDTRHYMEQGEQFVVIQNGGLEPRVWDGGSLMLISATGGAPPYLPAGTVMKYYMGRIWVASGGRQYLAGDIVLGPNGTAKYGLRDSILHNIENTYLSGGGSFIVPTTSGNIRALAYPVNLDTALGQGQLLVGTTKSIYSVNVQPERANWIALNNTNQALQRVTQVKWGFVGDRSVVQVNGDLFYQTLEPGVRSYIYALRYFNQWGQTPISRNEDRALKFNDRALLTFSSGIEFSNRLLQTTLPFQSPVGVAHRGLMPLDFDILSSLQDKLAQDIYPAWEGMWEGLDFLQLFEGDFGGLQRAFAVVLSRVSNQIEVWEITQAGATDNGDNRIDWYFESPSFDFTKPFSLKELETMELWYDQLHGTVQFELYFRPDQHPCWYFWNAWKDCSARDCREDPVLDGLPCVYPTQAYCNAERPAIVMPRPPRICNTTTGRPINLAYQFQVKLVVKGSCRIRGYLLHCLPKEKAPFDGIKCQNVL